ncbi:hypothetical protein NC653_020922 [Populus alba x Populus x berolinensis]|uniref:TFIIS-type domain-containing protein n=1 Tax=Populus alba x Populus x berolinensis TaxID=444605 RepID=A0AAD6MLM0_9ROSI|nr:hypothetical protein NC653_020922 [Populus alba x Populus x berolinensis]
MSSKKEEKSQVAADRIKAAALSAAKGLSRAQAERAAAAAARNVNAYGQKEEGPSRWQEKREAKRQMYLMSTEKAVRLGERKDLNSMSKAFGGNGQCQKCFQSGHWTYECKNERVYMSRPSRTQQLKNPKLRMKVSTSCDLENPEGEDEEGRKREKKSKRKHRSDSDAGSDSEASVFETDSGSSSVTGSESSDEESSSGFKFDLLTRPEARCSCHAYWELWQECCRGRNGSTRSSCSYMCEEPSQLDACIHQWKEKGLKVRGSVCDVSSQADRGKLINEDSSLFCGKLNILINNAGTNVYKQTLDYTAEDFSFVVNTNLRSAFHLSPLAHPLLKASGAGRILCVFYLQCGGIHRLTRNLACELAKDNIRVNSVTPWFIRTPMTEDTPMRRLENLEKSLLLWHFFASLRHLLQPDSNNILYPREDRDQKILLYACRNCDHQEIADDNCVYRNEVHHSVAERTQVLQDVAADPTLPRTKAVTCTVCKHPEAVFFQATSRGEEGMTLFFVCCNPNCGHRWRD